MAFQLRFSSEVVGDAEQATASWCKRRYGRNERVTRLGKAESTKPNLADTPPQNGWKSYSEILQIVAQVLASRFSKILQVLQVVDSVLQVLQIAVQVL